MTFYYIYRSYYFRQSTKYSRRQVEPGENMKRIDQICGLSVIDVSSGIKIGEVAHVVLDAENRCIAGIDISPRRFISGQRYIQFGDIEIFGDVSVLIKRNCMQSDEGYLRNQKSRRNQAKPRERLELGQKVYLTDGSDIGWFTNALIDEAKGRIQSLEVSQGFIDDLARGRCWINEFSCGEHGITALSKGRS